ncbi:hypothetical protein HXX76_002999 [Chlamydomonas incerta]|uniref:Uncharacterized protein n=1 Tax=Chlamydomonas incerta TaxID=51695 RepID=A0A835TG84_CHLIN|nr:hypothetical protein HXX76_002999 [Chlamydomonas incerta]|eukprot:KAG2442923.1 hypothetical protein HXX76_002999 [Chlamydomonas incerta]
MGVLKKERGDDKIPKDWASRSIPLFKKYYAQLPSDGRPDPPKRLAEFIRYQYKHDATATSVADKRRTGRNWKVQSVGLLMQLLLLVIETAPRTMMQMSRVPLWRDTMEAHGVKCKTLWRYVRTMCPALGKHLRVEYKMTLSVELMAERVETCVRWLSKAVLPDKGKPYDGPPIPPPPVPNAPNPAAALRIPTCVEDLRAAFLRRIIWIDAKKFYISPETFKAWAVRGAKSVTIQDARVRSSWCIHFYSAVNYIHGGILIKVVSGTKGKGYKPDKVYKTAAGDTARGPTFAEFQKFVADIKAIWDEKGERWDEVLLSWDNASVHGELDSEEWATKDARGAYPPKQLR